MTATADPSRRHVLPSDAPLVRNLAALWAADPELAAAVDAENRPTYAVEPSKSGEPTVAVPTADGRTIHLHSRHRPLEEAKRLIEEIDCEQHVFYHVHGLGLGYHLEILFERCSDEAVFCVFESDLLLLRTLLEARDLSKLISSRRVVFFWKMDKGDLFVRLLGRMMRGRRKPLHLILDGLPAHKTKAVKQYVAGLQDKLTLHFLPGYAPDLNPDELVWSHAKRTGNARRPLQKGEKLADRVNAQLADIRRRPALVRSFFKHPSVAYIADC